MRTALWMMTSLYYMNGITEDTRSPIKIKVHLVLAVVLHNVLQAKPIRSIHFASNALHEQSAYTMCSVQLDFRVSESDCHKNINMVKCRWAAFSDRKTGSASASSGTFFLAQLIETCNLALL